MSDDPTPPTFDKEAWRAALGNRKLQDDEQQAVERDEQRQAAVGEAPTAIASEEKLMALLLRSGGDLLPAVDLSLGNGKALALAQHRRIYHHLHRWWKGSRSPTLDAFVAWAQDQPSPSGLSLAMDLGGASHLLELSRRRVAKSATLDLVAAIQDAWQQRLLLDGADKVAWQILDGSTGKKALAAWLDVAENAQRLSLGDEHTPEKVAQRQRKKFEARARGEEQSGLDTGLDCFDQIYTPAPGTMTVAAGYSKHGKTTVSMAWAGKMALKHNALLYYYPCEGYEALLTARLLCSIWSDFPGYTWQNSRGAMIPTLREHWIMKIDRALENATDLRATVIDHYGQVLDWLEQSGIHLKPVGQIDIRQVESDLLVARAKHPDRPIICVVDYLQHCHQGDPSEREKERVAACSRRLGGITGKTGAITFALSQYTENGNEQATPIPMPGPHQVRGAKDIRNDAAAILTWHRPYLRESENEGCGVLEVLPREGIPMHGVLHMDGACKAFRWWDLGADGPVPSLPGVHTPRYTPPCQEDSGW